MKNELMEQLIIGNKIGNKSMTVLPMEYDETYLSIDDDNGHTCLVLNKSKLKKLVKYLTMYLREIETK